MRFLRLAAATLLALGSLQASAQLTQVTASNIVDGGGKKLKSGEIDLLPVTLAGNPIQPQLGGGGVILYKAAQCLIVNGEITTAADGSTCTVADTALTNQKFFCYKAQVKDTSVIPSNLLPVIHCLQPTGATWSLDQSYSPDAQPTALVQLGPKGDKGDPGNGLIANGLNGQMTMYNTNGAAVGPAQGITTDGLGNFSVTGQANANVFNAANNIVSPSGNIDSVFSKFLSASQSVTSPWIQGKMNGATYYADQFGTGSFDQLVNACISYGGIYGQNSLSGAVGDFTCDARRLTGSSNGPNTLVAQGNITIPNSAVKILMPCQAVNFGTYQIIVPPNVYSTDIEGCGQDATLLVYTGNSVFVQVGDPSFGSNTERVAFKHLAINTNTGGAAATAMAFYRTQDIDLDDVELNGNGTGTNAQQTGILLDGTGNYAGGTFRAVHLNSYYTSVFLTGHDSGSVIGDYANASTFERLHIDCPTQTDGSPITGTTGIALIKGDGNTFIGGDVEGCDTVTHLGQWAINNTIVGLRNEHSNTQYLADLGSAYNNVVTGGTFYTGQLQDYGSRNSFWDAFHHTSNGIKGDWYASQQDATITNHQRVGIGLGNERGLLNELQTDYGYRWLWGFSDGATGIQLYQLEDLLNNVNRLSIGQYLSSASNAVIAINVNHGGCYYAQPSVTITGGGGSGATATANVVSSGAPCNGYTVQSVTVNTQGSGYTSTPTVSFTPGVLCQGCDASSITATATAIINLTGSANNQTALNGAGTGNVCFQCSANSGTGGVAFASGGPTPTTVGTVDASGNAHFTGTGLFDSTLQSGGTMKVRNNADAEVDYYLRAGLSASQKESYTYQDFDGSSQWYMVKDQNNNWALNSAPGNLDSFKAYQSTNSGDTYINAQIPSGVVRINYETGSGTGVKIYGGNSSTLYAAFTAPNAITFPGLAASSGHNCLQIDNSGNITNTGFACGSSSLTMVDLTQNVTNVLPVGNGGTGANNAAGALANLGGVPNNTTVNGHPLSSNVTVTASDTGAVPSSTTVNGHPLSSNVTVTAADAGAVAKTNSLGCLDGWDHLPCTVYVQTPVSESAASGSYATVWTSTYVGVYRVTGYLYGTSASSTSCSVTEYAKAQNSGQSTGNGYSVQTAQVGTSVSSANGYPVMFNLAASIPVQVESLVSSGSCTGGAWTRAVVIERLQ